MALDLKNPHEARFVGWWEKMLARYGGGITPEEFDRIVRERLEAKIGPKPEGAQ